MAELQELTAWRTHHKECGGRAEKTQAFVEKMKKGRGDWTKGQRKRGVKREKRRSEIKKSTKIPLTEMEVRTILPVRQ
jgi:hypothetical protein